MKHNWILPPRRSVWLWYEEEVIGRAPYLRHLHRPALIGLSALVIMIVW